jgi:glycosyltransferase involved in cell wall biosynthesis
VDIGDWQAVPQPKESVLPRFVFIGRLVDWKAVDVVIRALEKVPVAELEIIGDGPMRHAWTRLAGDLSLQNRIQFTGWLPQQECAAHLHSATALVLPSLFECGGAVVLEAMAMGKPVIATRWGGPADYLDASSGMLVDPDSYSALVTGFATAMQKLIDSPALANSMGSAGRQRVLRDFDWQQKIDQVISIYRSLAEKTDVSQEFEDRRVSPAAVSQHH